MKNMFLFLFFCGIAITLFFIAETIIRGLSPKTILTLCGISLMVCSYEWYKEEVSD